MIIWRQFALVSVFWLLCSSGIAAQTATVRVRLVYLKNGKPAQGQQIVLDLGNPQHIPPAEWRSGAMSPKETTSSDGVAVFDLPKPLPRVVFVEYENGRITGCAKENLISLDDVLNRGVTIGVDKEFGASCQGDRSAIKRLAAKPGEIVMFVRKLSVWEKMQR